MPTHAEQVAHARQARKSHHLEVKCVFADQGAKYIQAHEWFAEIMDLIQDIDPQHEEGRWEVKTYAAGEDTIFGYAKTDVFFLHLKPEEAAVTGVGEIRIILPSSLLLGDNAVRFYPYGFLRDEILPKEAFDQEFTNGDPGHSMEDLREAIAKLTLPTTGTP
jgi:hypothetical protein